MPSRLRARKPRDTVQLLIGARDFSAPKHPDQFWGPWSLIFNVYWVFFSQHPEHDADGPPPSVMLMLRVSGAVLPLFHTPSWRAHKQLYLNRTVLFSCTRMTFFDTYMDGYIITELLFTLNITFSVWYSSSLLCTGDEIPCIIWRYQIPEIWKFVLIISDTFHHDYYSVDD